MSSKFRRNESRALVQTQPPTVEKLVSYLNDYFETFENNLKGGNYDTYHKYSTASSDRGKIQEIIRIMG